ncbi:hypothetical protein [Streptomyces sp. NPDC006463]|uniref:hypothetical protein n=1 Tax=Streptomyces sp. NPDC006463 TaxID=3364746 RepID=UPI0036A7612B
MLSGKLAGLTGVVVLAVAAWTMISAVQAGGWVTFDAPDRQTTASGPFIVEGGGGSGSGDSSGPSEAVTPDDGWPLGFPGTSGLPPVSRPGS